MARNIFRAGVAPTLTPEQLQQRLDDVEQRAAAGPAWQSRRPKEIFGGEETAALEDEAAWLHLRDLATAAHIKANRELAKTMRVHLRWEAEFREWVGRCN